MIRHRFLGTEDRPHDKPCHECGRRWHDLQDGDRLDPRAFVQLRGGIGHCMVLTVVCPQCATMAEVLWTAADYERINPIAEHRRYFDDIRFSRLLAEREMFNETRRFRPVVRFQGRAS